MAETGPSVEILDKAIAKDPSNAKLYGQRCTAYLARNDYSKALEDAKTLVKIIPDAPMGYLKAARCYRLQRKWKAAQKMLDVAAGKSDEKMLQAIRTEQRKLDADMNELEPCYVSVLPEELFVEVASYLHPADIASCTHVSRRWRSVLLSQPRFWQTLELRISSKRFLTQKPLSKLLAYKQRLRGAPLKSLLIAFPPTSDLPGTTAIEARSWHIKHILSQGILSGLESISLAGLDSAEALKLLRKCSDTLRYLRHHSPLLASASPELFINICSANLIALDVDKAVLPESISLSNWPPMLEPSNSPMLPAQSAQAAESQDPEGPQKSLRYLSVSSRFAIDNVATQRLQHLKLSHCSTTFPDGLPLLRTLDIEDSGLMLPNYDFPLLEELSLHRLSAQEAARIMFQLQTPKLQKFSLVGPVPDAPTGVIWHNFVSQAPLVTELRLDKSAIPKLSETLPLLSKLHTLQASSMPLSADFLIEATSHLTSLVKLDVSNSDSIKGGDLCRLVKAREGKLQELNIDGCTSLERAAVDWLKKNVKKVVFSGWRDKNDIKGWKTR